LPFSITRFSILMLRIMIFSILTLSITHNKTRLSA
jgi:hypothetical protein